MLLKITILKLSEKVKTYVEEVEKETGYTVLIENFHGKGAAVTLDHEHKYIHVEINEEEYIKDLEKGSEEEIEEEIDHTIAHEVTHEFLSLKKKYCRVRCGSKVRKTVEILVTMIEDIVVNKIIQEKNYRPYSTKYLDDINLDIEDIRKGRVCCEIHNDDPIYKFMVFRYILAWGFLKYLNLGEIDKKTIHKLLKIFQKSCPKQYAEAKKIKEIILENDIFTPEGYNNTIKKCLDLWNLTNLVEIYTC